MFFGASEDTLPYADEYFLWYMTGTVFALLATGMNSFVTAQGFARKAMFSVLLGAVMNIVLDPVFIFALDMGRARRGHCHGDLAGVQLRLRAALFAGARRADPHREAALGACHHPPRIAAGLHAVFHHRRGQRDDHRHERHPAALWRARARATCSSPWPPSCRGFMLVVTMPLGGISGGTQPILSFNYGARQVERVRSAQRRIFAWCLAFTAIMFCVAWAGGAAVRAAVHHRRAGGKKGRLGHPRCVRWHSSPLGLQYEIVDGFTAIGQVRYAWPLSFWRKAVYFAALFILPAIGGAEGRVLCRADLGRHRAADLCGHPRAGDEKPARAPRHGGRVRLARRGEQVFETACLCRRFFAGRRFGPSRTCRCENTFSPAPLTCKGTSSLRRAIRVDEAGGAGRMRRPYPTGCTVLHPTDCTAPVRQTVPPPSDRLYRPRPTGYTVSRPTGYTVSRPAGCFVLVAL